MKTSTMIIITAVLIIMGCLTAFNYNLKGEYLNESYKSRFRNMKFAPLKGVEKMDMQDANLLGATIEQGDKEGIWINNDILDKVQYVQHGNVLTLKAAKDYKTNEVITQSNGVIVVTKTLSSVMTTPNSQVSDKYMASAGIGISGYQLDSLDLQIGRHISLSLDKMNINTLHANVGDKAHGQAALVLSSGMKINTAELNVPGNSRLDLYNPLIVKATYNICDSATVTLSGRPVKMIK
jgi:hypothetical protein